MVITPTVLVLGAGASQAYGFPSGRQLIANVTKRPDRHGSSSTEGMIAAICGVDTNRIASFKKELLQSRRSSIDAFIEARSTEFDKIGRCAIAEQLLRYEDDRLLFPAKSEDDWYSTLFDAILGRSSTKFATNQLRVITFNFDRSFERALYQALETNFPLDSAETLSSVIPVLHVHGDLGAPLWQPRHQNSEGGRRYVVATDRETIAMCTERIRIVHHEISKEILQDIADTLAWAKRIYFIGFSYHELNLAKLKTPASLFGKIVRGTCCGMHPGPVAKAQRLLGPDFRFDPEDGTAHDAVRRVDWFYE